MRGMSNIAKSTKKPQDMIQLSQMFNYDCKKKITFNYK